MPTSEMITRARWRMAFDHIIRTPLSTYYVLYNIADFRGMDMTGAWPALYDGAIQFIAFALLEDTSTYWIHRAFHESKWLYRTFHKVCCCCCCCCCNNATLSISIIIPTHRRTTRTTIPSLRWQSTRIPSRMSWSTSSRLCSAQYYLGQTLRCCKCEK